MFSRYSRNYWKEVGQNLYIYILINKFTRSKDSRFNVEIDILWNENDMHILLGWKKKKKQLQKNQRKLKATLKTGVSINNWMFSRVDRSKNVETKRPPGTWLTNPSHIAFQRKTSRNTEARHPSSNLPILQHLLLHILKKRKKKKKNVLIETSFTLRNPSHLSLATCYRYL